jgi:Mn2+/Fe2+ NRAMP family transporter
MDNLEEKKESRWRRIALIIYVPVAFNVFLIILENVIPLRFAFVLAGFISLLTLYPFLIGMTDVRKWTLPSWLLVCVAISIFMFLVGYLFF